MHQLTLTRYLYVRVTAIFLELALSIVHVNGSWLPLSLGRIGTSPSGLLGVSARCASPLVSSFLTVTILGGMPPLTTRPPFIFLPCKIFLVAPFLAPPELGAVVAAANPSAFSSIGDSVVESVAGVGLGAGTYSIGGINSSSSPYLNTTSGDAI